MIPLAFTPEKKPGLENGLFRGPYPASLHWVLHFLLTIRDLRQQLLTRLILRAERFSETVQRATRFGMLLNDREHVLKIVEALGSQEGIEGIRVFSKKGMVMYSSEVREIGTALTKQDSACTVCHGVYRTPGKTISFPAGPV